MESTKIMRGMDVIAAILLVIGGLNWGLVGFFGFDLVAFLFGEIGFLSRIIYGVVGICAVYQVFQWRAIPRRWGCAFPGVAESAAK